MPLLISPNPVTIVPAFNAPVVVRLTAVVIEACSPVNTVPVKLPVTLPVTAPVKAPFTLPTNTNASRSVVTIALSESKTVLSARYIVPVYCVTTDAPPEIVALPEITAVPVILTPVLLVAILLELLKKRVTAPSSINVAIDSPPSVPPSIST